jgi:hypothetical protein
MPIDYSKLRNIAASEIMRLFNFFWVDSDYGEED